MFSLGMHLIDRFGVRVPLSEVALIATVGDLFDTMQRHA
jgi:acyl carrier protein